MEASEKYACVLRLAADPALPQIETYPEKVCAENSPVDKEREKLRFEVMRRP